MLLANDGCMRSRRPSSIRSLAIAGAATAVPTSSSMPYRPYFRGASQWGRRYYSDQASNPIDGNYEGSVSGDSHFNAIRQVNRGFRPVLPPRPCSTVEQSDHLNGPRQSVKATFYNRPQFRARQIPQLPRRRPYKPPDYREWEVAKPGPPSQNERFTILSYNILADYLAADHWQNLYCHIPQNIMDWDWRKRNIIFELGLWSADILCFQEVDRFQDILDELKPRGYTGIWKMRTGNAVDGCAIFWRYSRFKLLYEESIEYSKIGLRDNVAQICVLQSLNGQSTGNGASSPSTSGSPENANKVVVCNIHVLFNPKRGDIKLGQIRVLLSRAHSVSRLWDDAPIVICGDFNSTPMSPIYKFITEQKLDLTELARDKVSGQVTAEMHRSSMPPYANPRAQDAVNISGALMNGLEKAEGDSSLGVSCVHGHSTDISSSHLEVTLSASNSNENLDKPACDSVSYESTSVDIVMAEKSSLDNELVDFSMDGLREDSSSFSTDENNTGQKPFPCDLSSSSLNQELNYNGNEIVTENQRSESDMFVGSFSRSKWSPAEIEAATGDANCKLVEHPLKLSSAYSRVEDCSGTRDSCGEPLVTSYHRRFCGTVDYIWMCDGLEAAKVLGPIGKDVMLKTQGFPTRKWGSDHIALVTELAFRGDN